MSRRHFSLGGLNASRKFGVELFLLGCVMRDFQSFSAKLHSSEVVVLFPGILFNIRIQQCCKDVTSAAKDSNRILRVTLGCYLSSF